jgi:hypothetical protein
MSRYSSILLFLFIHSFSFSQDRKKFTVNPGEKVSEIITPKDTYKYPRFPIGYIAFKDGTYSQARINYNSLFREMQFINQKGDTLSIADEKDISWIAAEKDTFYFFEGWLEQIATNPTITIARKKTIEVSNKEKIGGMDVPTFGSVETNTKYSGSQHLRDLVAKEKLTFSEYSFWYFGDRFNRFVPATKKSLLKIYGKNQKPVEDFLDQQKIDFYKDDDMKKLVEFLKEGKK